MGNLISKFVQIAGAILSGPPLEAVQANVPSNTSGLSVGRDFTAQTVSVIVNSPTSITSPTTPFRFNIPEPNMYFKGREDTLGELKVFFEEVPVGKINFCDRIIVIAGSGGMGKTEIAYKVAAEFEDILPSVAWINAETEESLLQSFLGLAKELAIITKDVEKADMNLVKNVYKHIDKNDYGKVLFIFDNAIRFNSSSDKFGIYDYLTTDSLINKRYPYILITTQTHEWGKQTKVLQVDALSEENSLEFFRSSFRVESLECDEEFKGLHKVTEGYPLVMNLAASNIDYNRQPNDDSVGELQQKINGYIADLELEKESGKILNEEMKHWPTSYKKTLSAAWQLTFQRLEQERNGREALKVLQICSYLELPIDTYDVIDILTVRAICPHPVNMELQLRDLLYLLERFYAARILRVRRNNADRFRCNLGIHRLVQLAVRQQTNCSQVLQGIIGRKVLGLIGSEDYVINTSALHDAMKRTDLPEMTLASVGFLAFLGDPIASHIVQTRTPETKAAQAVWRLCKMEPEIRTSHANEVQLHTELIELWKSTEEPGDRQMYFLIAFDYLDHNRKTFEYVREDGTTSEKFFDRRSLRGIEHLACELISEFGLFPECRCGFCFRMHSMQCRYKLVSDLLFRLIEEFVRADVQQSELMRTQLTHAFLNFIPLLKQRDDWDYIWYKMSDAVGISQSRMAELRTSLWDNGLAQKLEHILQCHLHSNDIYCVNFALARCMDFCLDGIDSTDQRVQQVMSAFTEMTARVLAQIKDDKDGNVNWIAPYVSMSPISRVDILYLLFYDVCSVWILLLLMSEPSPSGHLLELLSRCEALTSLEGDMKDFCRFSVIRKASRKDLKQTFSQYIQKYSSSEVQRMQTLVAFGRMLLSLEKEDSSCESESTDETTEASSSDSS